MGGYRKVLTTSKKHHYLFVDGDGDCFEANSFSKYLGNLIERLSGQRVTSNLLRSSFISALYSETSDPAVRESAASVMRHSTKEAARTYDRRIPSAKKELGQYVLSKMSRKRTELEGAQESLRPSKTADCLFSKGDCVVVPYVDQDSGETKFHFGYIVKASDLELTLMELSLVNETERLYQPKLSSVWTEPTSACFHALCEFIRPSGCYQLLSPTQDVLGLVGDSQ